MPIVKPENMSFADKKFSVIIYGSPGVGKTTLALSAPDPIIIDFDRGLSRVAAQHRKTAIECSRFEDVLEDINSPIVKDAQSIIIDTGGSFISMLQDYVIRQNPKINAQKNGAISLKGFGAVKTEFLRFMEHLKTVLGKNVICVFHSEEKPDKDGNPQQRLMCEGAARNLVWTPCDFGGYIQMIGNERVICFAPEQEFFAKRCHGIAAQYPIPNLGPNDKNDFLTRLFASAKANINAEANAYTAVKQKYESAMETGREIISAIQDVDSANKAKESMKTLEHALTSQKELLAMFMGRIKEVGLIWDKAAQKIVQAQPDQKADVQAQSEKPQDAGEAEEGKAG